MQKPIQQSSLLLIKKLHPDAKTPIKGSNLAAGWDLHSVEDKDIPARGKAIVATGLAIAVPPGNYARIGI